MTDQLPRAVISIAAIVTSMIAVTMLWLVAKGQEPALDFRQLAIQELRHPLPLDVQSSDAEHVTKFGEDSAMERPAQPEELAPAYVFLASNIDSSYISGEILPVLGGDTIAG